MNFRFKVLFEERVAVSIHRGMAEGFLFCVRTAGSFFVPKNREREEKSKKVDMAELEREIFEALAKSGVFRGSVMSNESELVVRGEFLPGHISQLNSSSLWEFRLVRSGSDSVVCKIRRGGSRNAIPLSLTATEEIWIIFSTLFLDAGSSVGVGEDK